VEQVPTKSGDGEGGFQSISQLFSHAALGGNGQAHTLKVNDATCLAIEPDAKRLPPKGKRRAVRQGRSKKRKGGWKASTGLTRQQVSDMQDAANAARSRGMALGVVVVAAGAWWPHSVCACPAARALERRWLRKKVMKWLKKQQY
jgi:hypothetical protein